MSYVAPPEVERLDLSRSTRARSPVVTLVTGATGFIGRHLLAALSGELDGLTGPDSETARSVHIVSTQPEPVFEGVQDAAFTGHLIDLHNAHAVADLMDRIRPDELFHLAWFNGESANRYVDPANHEWAAITDNVVETFARAGGRRAVLAGSCAEYGPDGGVLSESDVARPDTAYGISKLDAGLRALSIADRYDKLSVSVARIFFVLGRFENPNRLVPYIVRQLLNDAPAKLSAGTQLRDYMHAWDVACALIALADSDLSGHVNVGKGTPVSVRELSEMISECLGRAHLLQFGTRPAGSDTAEEITANIARITSTTDWRPSLDLATASADVAKWWSTRLNGPNHTGKTRPRV